MPMSHVNRLRIMYYVNRFKTCCSSHDMMLVTSVVHRVIILAYFVRSCANVTCELNGELENKQQRAVAVCICSSSPFIWRLLARFEVTVKHRKIIDNMWVFALASGNFAFICF